MFTALGTVPATQQALKGEMTAWRNRICKPHGTGLDHQDKDTILYSPSGKPLVFSPLKKGKVTVLKMVS